MPRLWRLVLSALVIGLAVINAAGVYAQRVAAHLGERGATASALETQAGSIDAKWSQSRLAHSRVNSLACAIEEATSLVGPKVRVTNGTHRKCRHYGRPMNASNCDPRLSSLILTWRARSSLRSSACQAFPAVSSNEADGR
jgi:hypothetical protein